MTGRYARSVPLTIRGIAAEKYIGHPLPETIKEQDSDDCIDELSSSPILRRSNSRSDSVAERQSTRASSVQNGATRLTPNIYHRFSGSATERSSIYSFGDDEFDRQSSLSVQKLFDELELILFERSAVGSVHLRNECSVWKSVFPHLRVVGTVKFPQEDFGYKFFEHNEESDLTPRNAEDPNESQELVVKGKNFAIEKYSYNEEPGAGKSKDDSSFDLPGDIEELITQEGLVEEMLAFDIQIGENRNEYLQGDILQDLFSEMWSDVVNGLEEILDRQLHPQSYPLFGNKNTVPSVSDLFPNNQELNGHDYFLTRESTTISTVRPHAFDKASRRFSIGDQRLEEVLKISSKTLQTRDKNFIHDLPFDGDLTRPSSGYLPMSGRHFNSRLNDNTVLTRSKVVGGRGRLLPIATGDPFKTFILEDEPRHFGLSRKVIRGYKVTPLNDKVALLPTSSSVSMSRPLGPLPPITRDTNTLSLSSSTNNGVFRKKAMRRVRSALLNKAPHANEQVTERVWPSGDYTRSHRTMNTLYAMENPQFFGAGQRSSTTLGFNNNGAAGKSCRKLSIMGNRIPEYEAEVEDDCLSETTQLSTKISNKRFLHSNILRLSGEGFGRRGSQPHHHINTAIR